MPVRPVDDEKGSAECGCGTIKAPRLYEARGQCVILCGAKIPKKHVFCSPCAHGNHTGKPCDQPRRKSMLQFDTTCDNCGVDLARHSKGTDGRPRD